MDGNVKTSKLKSISYEERYGDQLDVREAPGQWQSRRHFLFAAIASAVGLGNIWRFPSLLKIHGGGAFLVAYFIITILCGLPMLYMEFGVGEIVKANLLHVWGQVHPLATGIGYSCSSFSIFVSSYYAMIIAWLLHYFLYSFQSPLPWIFCPFTKSTFEHIDKPINITLSPAQIECQKTTPEAYYWYRESLDISSGIESKFEWNVYLISIVAVVWFCVFLNLRNGIENASKIIFINVVFPYIALAILLVRTVFIHGSSTGLNHLFKPKWSSLSEIKLWTDAASQTLFSLSLGSGCMTIYGAKNRSKIKRSCLKDAIVVTFIDCFTSLLGALVVYSILGIRAEERMLECHLKKKSFESHKAANATNMTWNDKVSQNCTISNFIEEAESGTGLAFIDFTYTIAYLPGATLFSAVFFLTLFSLGFTSLLSFIVSANEVVKDVFKSSKRNQVLFFGLGCVCMFILNIFYTQPSGEYFIQLFGSYGQDIPILFIMLCESMAVASSKHIRKKLRDDMKHGGFAYLMEFICCVVNPIVITGIIISVVLRQMKSGGKYHIWRSDLGVLANEKYPVWANVVGLIYSSIPVLPLFIGFFYGIKIILRNRRTGSDEVNCNSDGTPFSYVNDSKH